MLPDVVVSVVGNNRLSLAIVCQLQELMDGGHNSDSDDGFVLLKSDQSICEGWRVAIVGALQERHSQV